MPTYPCNSKEKNPNWTCPDMNEDETCGRLKITCPFRGEAVEPAE